MNTSLLFAVTVLIWGTTWIAISAQVGDAPITVSVFYRFALAGLLMLAGLAVLGRLRTPAAWRFVVIQALCLFCFNFIALYTATRTVPSGLVSVIFSLAAIFNAINARIFFGDRISRQTLFAGLFGAAGVVLLFWRELTVTMDPAALRGIGWATLGTLVFSWGNMASRRNAMLGITPVIANAWGMGIGGLALLAMILAQGQPLTLPDAGLYLVALFYLAVIGSIMGFTSYLLLVGRIGSARAGYATVLFPVVALAASTVFEGYQWTASACLGVLLVGFGNVIMFQRR